MKEKGLFEMYCEDCGKKIDCDSVYCEYCGHKVGEEEIYHPKKRSKENKILWIVLLFVCFGFLFFWELKYFNSAENAMQNYLKNWETKNYDVILTKLQIDKNEFISVDTFQKAFEKEPEFQLTDFQVTNCTYQNNGKSAICYVSYQTSKNGPYVETVFQLERKAKNRMLLFADWTIQDTKFSTIKDWKLYLPSDSQGSIMGINLEEYRYPNDDKTGYDCYRIPEIFAGNYSLQMTLKNGMEISKEIMVSNRDYTYQFHVQDISDDFKGQLEGLGTSIIETIYQGISSKTPFEDLKSSYDISELSKSYETLLEETKESDLTNFKVMEMNITGIELNEEGKLYLSYQMSYEYDLVYLKDEKEVKHHGKSNDTFYVTISSLELKEIEKIDSLVTYFSKKY